MMKRFFLLALALLLAGAPGVRADGPDDDYVGIYNLIQQADALNEKNQIILAKNRYLDAQAALKKFQVAYPDWNVKVVRYRLNYLSTKVSQINAALASAPAPAATPATTAPAPAAHATAPAATTTPPAATAKPPPVQAEAPTPAPEATISAAAENQIKSLQDQLRRSDADKIVLQAKLREALSAQPAAVDPRELAKAEERIKELQKENELLKVSLAEARTNALRADPAILEQTRRDLAEANKKVAQLTQSNAALTQSNAALAQANVALATERESLLARMKTMSAPDEASAALRAENDILKKEVADLKARPPSGKPSDLNRRLLEAQSQIAALQSDKDILRLEKLALENRLKQSMAAAARPPSAPGPGADTAANEARIRQLEAERDRLQKSLDAANRELQARGQNKETTDRIDDLTRQLGALHSRLDVLEARAVPYTPEELALFKLPPTTLVASAHASARRSVRDLPPSYAKLVAEAEKHIMAGELDKAESACLELLKSDPKDITVLCRLGEVQVGLNRWVDAEQHLRQALAIDPEYGLGLRVLGRLKFYQKKYDDALEFLSHAATNNPQDPEIQNFLGLTLAEKGLRGPAETALRKAIQLDPGYGSAHQNLAVIYITQKPPLVELARWHYQKALAAGHPHNADLERLLDTPKPESAASK